MEQRLAPGRCAQGSVTRAPIEIYWSHESPGHEKMSLWLSQPYAFPRANRRSVFRTECTPGGNWEAASLFLRLTGFIKKLTGARCRTLGMSCCRKPERRRNVGCRQSAANPCSVRIWPTGYKVEDYLTPGWFSQCCNTC